MADHVSKRRACKVLSQSRSAQRRKPYVADDEPLLTQRIIALATEYDRYGYRRITALLRREGWIVNHKRVESIWSSTCLHSSLNADACGSTMVHVYACVLHMEIMCGAMILS